MQCVVLAAGRGARLAPLTDTTPKPLLHVGDHPLLAYILDALPEEISEIVLVIGYRGEQIQERIGTSWKGIPVRYVSQTPLDGTAHALLQAKPFLSGERFLVVNGDDLYAKKDLARLIAHPLAILIKPTTDPLQASAVMDTEGCLEAFEGNAPEHELKHRVCGAYVLDERFFRYPLFALTVRNNMEYSLPHTLLSLAKDTCVKAEHATFWMPVGTPEELAEAEKYLRGIRE